jgi:NAD(P)H-hydrate epimerase
MLTGLLGGLLAQATSDASLLEIVGAAAWWHSLAGIQAAEERTPVGVDAFTLTHYLIPALQKMIAASKVSVAAPLSRQ